MLGAIYRVHWRWAAVVLGAALVAAPLVADKAPAGPVAVRHGQGTLHGFLALRDTDGELIANGDLTQVAAGGRVTSHLVFHFKDESVHDETVVYSQRRAFELVSYHLVQKGPTFKRPTDMTIDGASGQVTVRYAAEDGKEQVASERLKLPANLANGMVPLLLANVPAKETSVKLAMIAATPKPRLVGLEIRAAGEDAFSVADSNRKAKRYVIKVAVGGVAGVVAPLVGKQPPDTSMWILEGEVPVFVRSEGPMFDGGPIWRTELASPAGPKAGP